MRVPPHVGTRCLCAGHLTSETSSAAPSHDTERSQQDEVSAPSTQVEEPSQVDAMGYRHSSGIWLWRICLSGLRQRTGVPCTLSQKMSGKPWKRWSFGF